MPHIKLHPNAPSCLCSRCESGHIYERDNGSVVAWCHESPDPIRVPLNIIRCSRYTDRRVISKYELEKIAWTIRHDRSGRVRGFEPPKKDESR